MPNLFIVGAPKCGTTAWATYLANHPDIYFSPIKEPSFFASDLPGRQVVSTQADYDELFRDAGAARAIGEASVLYLFSKVAAAEIATASPAARILIFLRDQEDMLPSLHHQLLYSFNESIEDFAEAWHLSDCRPGETIPSTCLEPKLLDYAAMGRFNEQVRRYYSHFPAEQIRVFQHHEWKKDPRRLYLEILEFLGVDDDGRTEFEPVNVAKHHQRRWLGRLLQRPPALVSVPIARFKQLLGVESLGVGARLAAANVQQGYTRRIDPGLRKEIRDYYASDNESLKSLLQSNALAVRASH